eukprot:4539815-Prorocentrum_lima.AAC.1
MLRHPQDERHESKTAAIGPTPPCHSRKPPSLLSTHGLRHHQSQESVDWHDRSGMHPGGRWPGNCRLHTRSGTIPQNAPTEHGQ